MPSQKPKMVEKLVVAASYARAGTAGLGAAGVG